MYSIIHLCFRTCFTDIQYLPEDDHDRSKRVGVLTVKQYNFNTSFFFGFILRIGLCVYVRSFWYSSLLVILNWLFPGAMQTLSVLSKVLILLLSLHLQKETDPFPWTLWGFLTNDDGRRPTCDCRPHLPGSFENKCVLYPTTPGHCVCTQQMLNCDIIQVKFTFSPDVNYILQSSKDVSKLTQWTFQLTP